MAVKLKTTMSQGSISDAISSGFSDLGELRDEMTEWRDNLEEKLSHTEKYERVSEAADLLENIADRESECELPDGAEDEAITWSHQMKQSKKSPYPRWLRLQNAVMALESAKDALETQVGNFEEKITELNDPGEEEEDGEHDEEKAGELEEVKEALDEIIRVLEEVVDEANGVEFPGMYG